MFNEQLLAGRVAVESIESFISQNIEEISAFSKRKLPDGLRQLLKVYNKRVGMIEKRESIQIEIKAAL
jgi:hypothetical protein